jgi:hypothetical protein
MEEVAVLAAGPLAVPELQAATTVSVLSTASVRPPLAIDTLLASTAHPLSIWAVTQWSGRSHQVYTTTPR